MLVHASETKKYMVLFRVTVVLLLKLRMFSVFIALYTVGVQEPFVQVCANFLVVRCPQLVGKEDQTTQSKSHQLPPETIGTMLACLQACCAYVAYSITITAIAGWLRSTVGRMPVFGRRTDPGLRSACSLRVTTMWVNRPLQVSQLSLSSFWGR